MFHSYFKIAIRSLLKNRTFALVNVGGLSLGIAAFILIFEYVALERSMNTFHAKLPSLYRMLDSRPTGEYFVQMAPAVAPLIQKEFGEVKAYCRVAEGASNGIVTVGNAQQSFREEAFAYADGSFFSLFTFPLLQGNPKNAITEPNTAALSATTAKKYFGTTNALGQTFVLHNQFGRTRYRVAAVYADMPANSDFQLDALLALQTLANPANLNGNGWARLDGFDGSYITNFFELRPNVDEQALEDKVNAFKRKLNPDDKSRFVLQPMAAMHLGTSLSDTYPTAGSLTFVYLLSGIAMLILVIAWFNYINLSTAASLKRAREIGVKKVIGAGKFQLISQLLGESVLLNVAALGFAMVLVMLVQASFNEFSQKNLSVSLLLSDTTAVPVALFLLSGALLSGAYVAFSVASLPPVQVLKTGFKSAGKDFWVRKVLVVAQFSVSVVLIIATLVLYNQLKYMQQKDLGFQAEQRLVINGPQLGDDAQLTEGAARLDDQLAQLPFVSQFSHTGIVPGSYYSFNASGIVRQGDRWDDSKKGFAMGIIDDRYLKVFDIGIVAGRNFTVREAEQAWEKSGKLMVNESAARQLGFTTPQAAVGAIIEWGKPFEIVGVVKDYNHQGLQKTIDPIIFMPRRSGGRLALKVSTDNIQQQLRQLETLYKAAYPGNPFEYFFVDQQYNDQYRKEMQYGQLFAIASGLAIAIACLGLFGLATHMTEQRRKEIGVRKVLGASIVSILSLVSSDFMRLVAIAIVIACPLGGYLMHQWLQNFAYQSHLGWWMFAASGALVVLIALLTVGVQSLKAALANPVNSLRSEQ